jgi:hypothetical protein
MAKAIRGQQTFNFDEEPEETPVDDNVWHEVPPRIFRLWSNADQLLYCAARDEDSAAHADTPEDAAWYRARAESYKQEYRSLR